MRWRRDCLGATPIPTLIVALVSPPKLVTGFAAVADAGGVLVPELITGRGQSGARAIDDMHGAGIGNAGDLFGDCGDRQVSAAIAVEVAAAHPVAELVAGFADFRDAWSILMPELIASRKQAHSRRAIQHMHGPDIVNPRQILEQSPNRQVVRTIAIEITCRQRMGELVAGLGDIRDVAAVLIPELAARARQTGTGPIEDVHRPGGKQESQVFLRDADG